MNSLERVLTALEHREPDRVPVIEWVISDKIMDALRPGCTYFEFNDWIGLDNVGFNRSSWRRDSVVIIDEARGLFRDHWGVLRAFGAESTPYPIEGPIKSPEDVKTYQPPDPEAPGILENLSEIVACYKGKKAICAISRDAFFNASYLRDQEKFLVDMYDHPKLVHELIDIALSYDLRVAQRFVQAGVDIVVLADDYAHKAGPMMSPKHFKEFILPGLKRAVDNVHAAGAYVIKHTDGNIMPLIDMIIDTGIDGLNPIEPAAGMDIALLKKRYGSRITLAGNIDCGHLLSHGSVEEVRRVTRETIKAAAPGGGFLLSSSNSIHSSVKPENYLAMVETGKEFGRYPIH